MDPKLGHITKSYADAIALIDDTEPVIRHLIETRLMDIGAVPGTKVKNASAAAKDLAAEINAIRAKAIKAAFRLLRDVLPSK